MQQKSLCFLTSADLTRTLNLATGTITLGISSTLEARIAALETELATIPTIYTGPFFALRCEIGMNTYTVTFPSNKFSAAPRVLVGQAAGNATGHDSINRIYAINVTSTQFDLIIHDKGGSNDVTVDYIAVQM